MHFPKKFESFHNSLGIDSPHIPYDCTNHWEDLDENSLVLGLPAVTVLASCLVKWNLSCWKLLGDRLWFIVA